MVVFMTIILNKLFVPPGNPGLSYLKMACPICVILNGLCRRFSLSYTIVKDLEIGKGRHAQCKDPSLPNPVS